MKKVSAISILMFVVILSTGYFLKAASNNKAAVLDGIYATSVSGGNDAYNLIDGNEKTAWVLMPGAGVDEGVMFNFSSFNYIYSMKISAPDKNISSFEIYVNGEKYFSNAESGVDIPLKVNVKSLYVKINGVEQKNQTLSINEIYLYSSIAFEIACQPPVVMTGKIDGSSILEPEEAYNYDFLFDSRRDFGWADGNIKLTGENEFIKFHFDKNVNISKIKIWNGYHRSWTHFEKNEAVKEFTFSDSGKSGRYTVPSEYMPHEIDFGKIFSGKVFTLTVNSVRKGLSYKDLVISELMFFDGKKWFVLNTGKQNDRKNSVIAKSKSGVLNNYLDKRKVFSMFSQERTLEQSIILRSNGSFVVYKNDIYSNNTNTVIADGNWQIVNNTASSAEVKIFGRLRKIVQVSEEAEEEEGYNPYSGENGRKSGSNVQVESSDEEVIFSDVLDITPDKIVSRKKIIDAMNF